MPTLSNRNVEFAQTVFQAAQDIPFFLERMGFGNEDFQREKTDLHRLKKRIWTCRSERLRGHLLHRIRLNDVTNLNVIEILEPDAAFKSGPNLRSVVLESLERRNLSFV